MFGCLLVIARRSDDGRHIPTRLRDGESGKSQWLSLSPKRSPMAQYHRDDSSHYFDRRELLEVDCHAKVVDVFRKLGARPRSAIIVCEHARPERYVNGHHLATAYLEATKSDSSVYDLDVRTFLDSP